MTAAHCPRGPATFAILACVTALLLPCTDASCQSPWYVTRGGGGENDAASAVATDGAGAVYIAVEQAPQRLLPRNIVVYKFDAVGRELWRSTAVGRNYDDRAFAIAACPPEVVVCGRSDENGGIAGDRLLARFDAATGALLATEIGTEGAAKAVACLASGTVLAFDGPSASPGATDVEIRRLDSSRTPVWSSVVTESGDDEPVGAPVFIDTTIHIALRRGGLLSLGVASGTPVRHIPWTSFPDAEATSIACSAGGALYVAGILQTTASGTQIILAKLGADGGRIWERLWGGAGDESSPAVACIGDTAVFVGATTSSYGEGGTDCIVVAFDSSGRFRGFATWGGRQDDAAAAMARVGETLYLAGSTASYAGKDGRALLLSFDTRTLQFPEPLDARTPHTAVRAIGVRIAPHPVRGVSMIALEVPERSTLTVTISDALGREVLRLADERRYEAGSVILPFPSAGLPPGLYVCTAAAGRRAIAVPLIVEP